MYKEAEKWVPHPGDLVVVNGVQNKVIFQKAIGYVITTSSYSGLWGINFSTSLPSEKIRNLLGEKIKSLHSLGGRITEDTGCWISPRSERITIEPYLSTKHVPIMQKLLENEKDKNI